MEFPANPTRYVISQDEVELLLGLNHRAQMGGSSHPASSDTTNASPNMRGATPAWRFNVPKRAGGEGNGTHKAVTLPVLRHQGKARAQATQDMLARPQPQLPPNAEYAKEKYFEACRKELSYLIKFMNLNKFSTDPTSYLSHSNTPPSQDPAVKAYCRVHGDDTLGLLTSAIEALRNQPAQCKRRYDLTPADERTINILIDALQPHPQRDEFQIKLRELSERLKQNGLTLDNLLSLDIEMIDGMLNQEPYKSISARTPVHMLKALKDTPSPETIQQGSWESRIVLPPVAPPSRPSAPPSDAFGGMEGGFLQEMANQSLPGLIRRAPAGRQRNMGFPFPSEPISPNNAAGREGNEVPVENNEPIIKNQPWSPSETDMSKWSAKLAVRAFEIFISRASSSDLAKSILSNGNSRTLGTWIKAFQQTENGRCFEEKTIKEGIQIWRAQRTHDRLADVEALRVPLRRVSGD